MNVPDMKKNGFTLLELMMAVALYGMIVLGVSMLFSLLMNGRIKQQAMAEVESTGAFLLSSITQTIRNAEGITSPLPSATDSRLVLDVLPGTLDPTVFEELNNTLIIQEGQNSSIILTTPSVMVSHLTFENLSRSETSGTVRISFFLTYTNPAGTQPYTYVKSFSTSASLRQP